MSRTTIPYSGYGSQGLQVFTPSRIEVIAAAGTLAIVNETTGDKVVCIRVNESTDYTINNTGTTATMPAGCTGIAEGVTSLGFPNGATVEVM